MQMSATESPLLTIFIPSYNRADKLRRALNSIFKARAKSRFASLVKVLVVDDFSSEPVEAVVQELKAQGNELEFRKHHERCGVAEIAMLRSLEFIETEYAWCVGNDDELFEDSLDFLVPILLRRECAFYLLNFLGRSEDGSTYTYLMDQPELDHHGDGRSFFHKFGLVTATTTFPCLCFKVSDLRSLDFERFFSISPIYSHTAAFFTAFLELPCVFLSRPVVYFNHNELEDELRKLHGRNSSLSKPTFYHASAGLARQLCQLSTSTGTSLYDLVRMNEHEVAKTTKVIKRSLLGAFIYQFSISQFQLEVSASRTAGHYYNSREDILAVQKVLDDGQLGDFGVFFRQARFLYCSRQSLSEKASGFQTLLKLGDREERRLLEQRM